MLDVYVRAEMLTSDIPTGDELYIRCSHGEAYPVSDQGCITMDGQTLHPWAKCR